MTFDTFVNQFISGATYGLVLFMIALGIKYTSIQKPLLGILYIGIGEV